MLQLLQITSADGAARYLNHARRGDYLAERGRVKGQWLGSLPARLGLPEEVTVEDFRALANNRHPVTGEQLTPRNRRDRTVGNEMLVDAPKSVSLVWALAGDERVRDAFIQSNDETVLEMEKDMATRVRRDGRMEDRVTGNAAVARYIHETGRPAKDDGRPDMLLHAHNEWMNLTHDAEEDRIKAAKVQDFYRDSAYYRAVFETKLTDKLRALGYAIEYRGNSWEIAGISRELIEKFSRRTEDIEQVAEAKGITDPARKAQLGRETRAEKTHDLSDSELRQYWRNKLTDDERRQIAEVVERAQARGRAGVPALGTAEEALGYARRHLGERYSGVAEKKLLAEALRYGVGLGVTVEGVQAALRQSRLPVVLKGGRRYVVFPEAWNQEQEIIAFARAGRGAETPLGRAHRPFGRDWLNRGQRNAVTHILNSCDKITLVIGDAGVGKTTLLKEAKDGIEENGKRLFAFSVTADASRGTLRHEGFVGADTVARLLVDEKLQAQVRGQVALVDEAWLLSTNSTAQLFDLAERLGFRLLLVGDPKQHASPERAGVMRLLEDRAGLVPARVTEIQRQQGPFKTVAEDLARGDTDAALDKLSGLGCVRVLTGPERERQLAAAYVQAVLERKKNGDSKTALVVSPTHTEGARITDAIRSELKRRQKLGAKERPFLRLENLYLTEAQRGDARHYDAGMVCQFFQNTPGFRRGERVTVAGRDDGGGVRVATAAGEIKRLPLELAGRFQVFRASTLNLAVGDRGRITQNGFSRDDKRLDNGDLFTVAGFTARDDIVDDRGRIIDRDFGHVNYGYVITSHASQSKTVDQVFIGQSAASSPAASREQLYVSVTRGRERAVIYTDDRDALYESVRKSDERLTATELLDGARPLLTHVGDVQRWDEQWWRDRELDGLAAAAWPHAQERELHVR